VLARRVGDELKLKPRSVSDSAKIQTSAAIMVTSRMVLIAEVNINSRKRRGG
jgi:hypothetical protein